MKHTMQGNTKLIKTLLAHFKKYGITKSLQEVVNSGYSKKEVDDHLTQLIHAGYLIGCLLGAI